MFPAVVIKDIQQKRQTLHDDAVLVVKFNYTQGLSLGMEERAMIMAGPETRPLMARWVDPMQLSLLFIFSCPEQLNR